MFPRSESSNLSGNNIILDFAFQKLNNISMISILQQHNQVDFQTVTVHYCSKMCLFFRFFFYNLCVQASIRTSCLISRSIFLTFFSCFFSTYICFWGFLINGVLGLAYAHHDFFPVYTYFNLCTHFFKKKFFPVFFAHIHFFLVFLYNPGIPPSLRSTQFFFHICFFFYITGVSGATYSINNPCIHFF